PVYRFNAESFAAPNGAHASDVADLWLPPTYLNNSLAGSLTQRAGASLTLSSLYDFSLAPGAAITVDPGQNVAIFANRQTTVVGSVIAHGGNITIASLVDVSGGRALGGGFGLVTPTRSVWIGDDSTLDVSAQVVMATDTRGHNYGIVPSGGSINIGGSSQVV